MELVRTFVALMLLSACATTGSAGKSSSPPTIVFFVRHAEKASDDPRDPSLSEAGRARALVLADLLAQAGVTHLFATEYRRTRETLEPLASKLGMEIWKTSSKATDVLVRAIEALPAGSVAVVAGHSNTIPLVIRRLGGEVARIKEAPEGPMLEDDEYDRLFVVIFAGSAARVLELRYGVPNVAPAAASRVSRFSRGLESGSAGAARAGG